MAIVSSPESLSTRSRFNYGLTTLKNNRIRGQEAEAGLDARILHDPDAPYRIPNDDLEPSPWGNDYQEAYNNSIQASPSHNMTPLQISELPANEMYDPYEENKSAQSRLTRTCGCDESVSNFGPTLP